MMCLSIGLASFASLFCAWGWFFGAFPLWAALVPWAVFAIVWGGYALIVFAFWWVVAGLLD